LGFRGVGFRVDVSGVGWLSGLCFGCTVTEKMYATPDESIPGRSTSEGDDTPRGKSSPRDMFSWTRVVFRACGNM